jgi:bile acid:Na+ symporter, BASS family
MDAARLTQLAVTTSVLLLVFALGLGATVEQATYVVRRPAKFVRALLAMYVVVPAFVAFLAWTFNLHGAVEIALIAAAVSPVPPVLPSKQLKMGGRANYVYGLLIAMSMVAIVTVPAAIELLGWLFGREAHINATEVARLVGLTVFAPVVAGLAVRHFAPALAERVAPWMSRIGSVFLIAGLLPILIAVLPPAWSLVGNGTILAIVAAITVALAAGHWLGGPDPGDRQSLAIASAMRHPGVALAIARLNFSDDRLVPAAILLFLLVGAVATSAYGALTRRAAAAE